MNSFNLNNCSNVLILGQGDIGTAIQFQLEKHGSNIKVYSASRTNNTNQSDSQFFIHHDPLSEKSWSLLTSKLRERTSSLDLIISTYGLLHSESIAPEKKLEDINLETLNQVFQVNAFTAPLSAKYLQSFLSKETPSVLVYLSAKVGSISDNRIGGWYGYRSSKAALNMFAKTISIELKRKKYKTHVMLIHPGTTKTKLSRPFLGNTQYKVWTPEETAKHVLEVIFKYYNYEENCSFLNWDGEVLPW